MALQVKLKVLVTLMMVSLFIFIIIYRQNPFKPLWNKLVPHTAYWNLQQQILDSHNKPDILANFLPRWRSDSRAGSDPCQGDLSVTTKMKDYNSLPQRFKDFLIYMHCRSYPLKVDQPDLCKEPPFLLLAIKSLAPHFDRRQAIRESWGRAGSLGNHNIVTVFLLGNATAEDHQTDLSALLQYESQHHKDIIQWDFRDSFFNLTVKEVLFLEWIQTRCRGARFIFKGDDDVFVNTYRILNFLKDLPESKAKDLFIGDVITNAQPKRIKSLKYFIPKSMYEGVYPPYAGGGGYLYSGDLAARLHNVTQHVVLYPIDDVYTGMCLRKLGLAPQKHKDFRTFNIEEKDRSNPCVYNSLMLIHPRTPQEIIQIWTWLSSPNLACQ